MDRGKIVVMTCRWGGGAVGVLVLIATCSDARANHPKNHAIGVLVRPIDKLEEIAACRRSQNAIGWGGAPGLYRIDADGHADRVEGVPEGSVQRVLVTNDNIVWFSVDERIFYLASCAGPGNAVAVTRSGQRAGVVPMLEGPDPAAWIYNYDDQFVYLYRHGRLTQFQDTEQLDGYQLTPTRLWSLTGSQLSAKDATGASQTYRLEDRCTLQIRRNAQHETNASELWTLVSRQGKVLVCHTRGSALHSVATFEEDNYELDQISDSTAWLVSHGGPFDDGKLYCVFEDDRDSRYSHVDFDEALGSDPHGGRWISQNGSIRHVTCDLGQITVGPEIAVQNLTNKTITVIPATGGEFWLIAKSGISRGAKQDWTPPALRNSCTTDSPQTVQSSQDGTMIWTEREIGGTPRAFQVRAFDDNSQLFTASIGGVEYSPGMKLDCSDDIVFQVHPDLLRLPTLYQPESNANVSFRVHRADPRDVVQALVQFATTPFPEARIRCTDGFVYVDMSFADVYGSHVDASFWFELDPYSPLLDAPWVRGLIWGFGCGTLIIILLYVPFLPKNVRAAVVLFLFATLLSVPYFAKDVLHENSVASITFEIALFIPALLLITLGLVSDYTFAAMVAMQPFKTAGNVALSSKRIRDRYYAMLNERFRNWTNDLGRGIGERYVPLPALLEEVDSDQRPSDRPDEEVRRVLTAHRSVLVVGMGGNGKSALIRKAVLGGEYHPVLLSLNDDDDLVDVAAKKLSTMLHDLPHDFAVERIKAGDFLFVIDDVGPAVVPVKNYVESTMYKSPILAATRANEMLAAVTRQMGGLVALMQPISIDHARLLFNAYCPDSPPTDNLLTACRDRNGGYRPLLIQLAAVQQKKRGAAEAGLLRPAMIYANALAALLPSEDLQAKTIELERLCMGTYWLDGRRTFAMTAGTPDGLFDELRNAGLLLSADRFANESAVGRTSPQPNLFRFFHDTMQSYLTARALRATPAKLRHAAGEARFLEGDPPVSELYAMCLEVWNSDEIDQTIAADLAKWARSETIALSLTTGSLLAILPPSLASAAREAATADGVLGLLDWANANLDRGARRPYYAELARLIGAAGALKD